MLLRLNCFLFRFSLTFPVRGSSRGSTTLRSAARIFIPKNEKPRRRRPELRSRKVGHFWGTGKPKRSHPSPCVSDGSRSRVEQKKMERPSDLFLCESVKRPAVISE